MALSGRICKHLIHLKPVFSENYFCEECIKTGDTWVHLRTCQTCGKVHCCDNSENKHATRHYQSTAHPVIISAEPGEQWAWCYPDETFTEYFR